MKTSNPPAGYRRIARHDQLFQENRHDPYVAQKKPVQPTVCPECNVVYENGKWRWGSVPVDAHASTCPACQRIQDRFPAGYITVEGSFLKSHRQEIEHLIRNHETHERAEHPLQRIMTFESSDQQLHIETTDIHLARGIGEALHDAYDGSLDYHYNPSENLLRVTWSRQAD